MAIEYWITHKRDVELEGVCYKILKVNTKGDSIDILGILVEHEDDIIKELKALKLRVKRYYVAVSVNTIINGSFASVSLSRSSRVEVSEGEYRGPYLKSQSNGFPNDNLGMLPNF